MALLDNAQADGYLLAGTGNPADGFVEVGDSDLQLALTARQTQVGTAYDSVVDGGVTRFTINDASAGIRFAYSVASMTATLDDFDIKMKLDMDAGLGADFKTFILVKSETTVSGLAWVLDADNDGMIGDAEFAALTNETAGAYIVDDAGNLNVAQNIMNLGWFDNDLTSSVMQRGTYDIVLEAYAKGETDVLLQNKIVLEVAGGAKEAYTPPVPTGEPSGEGFNSAQTGVTVAAFLTGVAPTEEKQASLAAFAQLQYDAYAAKGVSDPLVGSYEALGRSFADTIDFMVKYGAQTEPAFIQEAYFNVFGRGASTVQQGHFQAQIDYFEEIYGAAGIGEAQAQLFAKGAILGQMLGHAANDGLLV